MKIIITENQKKSLLIEGVSDKISKSYKSMVSFTQKVLKETAEVTNMDFGFLLSWGATLGGLMMPVTQFIKGNYTYRLGINEFIDLVCLFIYKNCLICNPLLDY